MFAEQVVVALHQHNNPLLGQLCFVALAIISVWLYFHRIQQRKLNLEYQQEHDMGITLQVEGMSCQHCVANVKKSLEAVPGVTSAMPNLDSGEVIVDGDQLDSGTLKQTIVDAGYTVRD
jgi:copper chaperone CopZ